MAAEEMEVLLEIGMFTVDGVIVVCIYKTKGKLKFADWNNFKEHPFH